MNRRERKERRAKRCVLRLCVGVALNFNVKILTHGGIMRKVNGFAE